MANQRARYGVTILRAAVASIFVVHGATRTLLGTVGDFGAFLSGSGLPAGAAIAWTITVVEIVGGVVLAAGLAVIPLAAWFGIQIAAGIVMVHGKAGWFVVGAGRNGAEYSALILACLLVVALTDSTAYKPRIGSGGVAGLVVLVATAAAACARGEVPRPAPSASPAAVRSQLAEDLAVAEQRHAGGLECGTELMFAMSRLAERATQHPRELMAAIEAGTAPRQSLNVLRLMGGRNAVLIPALLEAQARPDAALRARASEALSVVLMTPVGEEADCVRRPRNP
jgi:putative oxidoreductase